jgi:tetratricopeptide (TPR) repeat protein
LVPGLLSISLAAAIAPEIADDAEKDLFAARYKQAAEAYSAIVKQNSDWAPGYYGLVRALIEDHRAKEAYAAAAEGLRHAPEAAETLTAAGFAAFRQGDLLKAEEYFNKARKVSPQYPAAQTGTAELSACVSRFKTARNLRLAAYAQQPNNPELISTYADTLKGVDHIAALERALALYDPASHEARGLRVHIAGDKAVGTRKIRQLASPYQTYKIKMSQIFSDTRRVRGLALYVKLNGRQTVHLLLDTGASGISISPKAAQKAELERLGDETAETRGIGDEKPLDEVRYLASTLEIGGLSFTNYLIGAFRTAKDSDIDGLIGADAFRRFLVTIDFPREELILEPYANGSPASDEPEDAPPVAAGFSRALRFGSHFMLPTTVNDSPRHLFLIDSGSSVNLIDSGLASEVTRVRPEDRISLYGVQGRVKEVSRADKITLVFAGFRQENPALLAMSMEKQGDSFGAAIGGILGMPVLWNLKMTLDYRAGAVRLERSR